MFSHALTKFEDLSDDLHVTIFKYLSIYDRYLSFFALNNRYAHLVKSATPTKINTEWLNNDINQSGRLISDYWVWNDKFTFYLIPTLQPWGPNCIKWQFIETEFISDYAKQLDQRAAQIISKYKIESNAPGLLVTQVNYYFCSIQNDLAKLEGWIRENYPNQYEVIRTFGPRHHLPKRITHYDGQYAEIKECLTQVQCLERMKRKDMIHQHAQQIWEELKRLDGLNLSTLVSEE